MADHQNLIGAAALDKRLGTTGIVIVRIEDRDDRLLAFPADCLEEFQTVRPVGSGIEYDEAIVGFDDAPMASRLWPTMTSVRLPLRQMGRIAGELLTSDGLHDRPPTPREIVPELIVRNSTVALRL